MKYDAPPWDDVVGLQPHKAGIYTRGHSEDLKYGLSRAIKLSHLVQLRDLPIRAGRLSGRTTNNEVE